MYEFTYFGFFQIPNKIPRKNKIHCASAASTVPIGAKPYDPNEDDDDDYVWVEVVHPSNIINVEKNNVGDKFCGGNVDKGSADDGQSVAAVASTAAAKTEIYRKQSNVEGGLVSYFQYLYMNSHII